MRSWSWQEKAAFGAFLFWSVAGLLSAFFLRPEVMEHASWPGWLRSFVDFCLGHGDPILILLAFANTHLHAARQWNSHLARRWALIVFVLSLAIESLGAWTGFPFGPYHYTTRFGPLLGIVPFTIPLAWNVVVTNSLFLVRMTLYSRTRWLEAVLVGLLCTFYDFILEPFATTVKGYWMWSGGVIPWQNYAAWFVLSGLLIALVAPRIRSRFPRDPRPWVILGVTILIFFTGRWLAP